jgi:hypothetical protein
MQAAPPMREMASSTEDNRLALTGWPVAERKAARKHC